VLVNLAKYSISSHFSGNECIAYIVKNCFTGRPITDSLHRAHSVTSSWPCSSQTDIMWSKLSWRKLILFNFNGQMLDRLLLQIRAVTENRHSTGTGLADMPRNSAASCCNIG